MEVEEAAFEVDEARAEGGVGCCQGTERGEAGEEDVDRDLEARLGRAEDVLRGEDGEGLDEEDEGDEEEGEERAEDGR